MGIFKKKASKKKEPAPKKQEPKKAKPTQMKERILTAEGWKRRMQKSKS